MAVQPTPYLPGQPAPIAERLLRRWDWILGALFLVLFWALAFGAGLKGLLGIGFVIFAALTFLYPRVGIALVVLLEAVLATFIVFIGINQIPAMRGGEGQIGWILPPDQYVMLGCVGILVVLWVGVLFRQILEGVVWVLTPLERALMGLLALTTAWIGFSAAYGHNFVQVLNDQHLIIVLATAVLVGRVLQTKAEWLGLIGLLVVGSLLHQLALIADLLFGGAIGEPEYFMGVLRLGLGGSPDLAGLFVPVMLALEVLVAEGGSRKQWWWLRPATLIFILRTLATMSRSALAHLILSMTILAALLRPGAERRRLAVSVSGTALVLVVVIGGVLVVSPALRRAAQYAMVERLLDVSGGREKEGAQYEYNIIGRAANADGTSDIYRILETEVALEQIGQDWITGLGPGATIAKRFTGVDTARYETYLHNGYLWYLLKFGAIGLLILAYCVWRFFAAAHRGLQLKSLAPWERALTIGFVASMAPLLAAAAVNNIIGAPSGLYFLMPAFAWICFLERRSDGDLVTPAR